MEGKLLVIFATLLGTYLENPKDKIDYLKNVSKNYHLETSEYREAIKIAFDFYEELSGEKIDKLCPKLEPSKHAKIVDNDRDWKKLKQFFINIGMPAPATILDLNIESLETLRIVHQKYKKDRKKIWKSYKEIVKGCLSDHDVEHYIGHYLYLMDKMERKKPSRKTIEYLKKASNYNPIPPRSDGKKFHPLKALGHVLHELNDKSCLFYYKKSVEYNEYSENIDYIGVLDNLIKIIEPYINR